MLSFSLFLDGGNIYIYIYIHTHTYTRLVAEALAEDVGVVEELRGVVAGVALVAAGAEPILIITIITTEIIIIISLSLSLSLLLLLLLLRLFVLNVHYTITVLLHNNRSPLYIILGRRVLSHGTPTVHLRACACACWCGNVATGTSFLWRQWSETALTK